MSANDLFLSSNAQDFIEESIGAALPLTRSPIPEQ